MRTGTPFVKLLIRYILPHFRVQDKATPPDCQPRGLTLSVCTASEPEHHQREKTAHKPGQGADHENQGSGKTPQIPEPHCQRLDLG